MSELENLPPSVAEIATVIGREKTLILIGSLPASGSRPGRKCLYVPKRRLKVDHWLVERLGWHAAEKLQRAFSGMILQPSNVRFWAREIRDRRICELHKRGLSTAQIAEEVGLSTYRIREILIGNTPEEAR